MNELTSQLSAVFKPLVAFLRRFHTILFFLLVSAGLFAAILSLLAVITLSSGSAASSSAAETGFDQDAIDAIENLGTRDVSQPGQRSNPFTE